SPYGAMIVAGPEGFRKNAYRKFSIRGEDAAGDDYAMMREVLTRRFSRALKEDPARDRGTWPTRRRARGPCRSWHRGSECGRHCQGFGPGCGARAHSSARARADHSG